MIEIIEEITNEIKTKENVKEDKSKLPQNHFEPELKIEMNLKPIIKLKNYLTQSKIIYKFWNRCKDK
jgi:hypothetical protein